MLFNSLAFLVFFSVFVILYFLLPNRYRWMLLLAGSSYFYMAFIPKYILILFAVILIDYLAGLVIEKSGPKNKKYWLYVSIASNVGILAVFKYFNFFIDNLNQLSSVFNLHYPLQHLSWILPIGLSFHTFQSLSYIIEVYRGNYKAERHLGIYACYVMFFPQLVAGPIERPQNLIHQFREKHEFESARVSSGLRKMLLGYFKKVVVADNAAQIANYAFSNTDSLSALSLIIGTVMFAFQIYGDFSGYSDIAIGSARVLGFRLMENFSFPYFAASISEFWRSWHISLTTWFRDYVYIPLGGNRAGKLKQYRNIMAVFLLSGLWHGANWTYVFWGGLNGFYLIFSSLSVKYRSRVVEFLKLKHWPKLYAFWRWLLTFSLVCLAWIFFRTESLTEAIYVINKIFLGAKHIFQVFDLSSLKHQILAAMLPGIDKRFLLKTIFFIVVLLGLDYLKFFQRTAIILRKSVFSRWALYYAAVLTILVFGFFGHQPFIYFQF